MRDDHAQAWTEDFIQAFSNFREYLGIFSDVDVYLATLTGAQIGRV